MTQLPEPNFIERDPDVITKEWITAYEEKSGKVLQPAQIERLMIDVGAYRETVLRMKIQETAKQHLLSYAPLDILEHIGVNNICTHFVQLCIALCHLQCFFG